MALSFSLLSQSAGGQNIAVSATATTGTLIHQTDISTTIYHRIYIYASNSSTADALLTMEWGQTATADVIKQTIPAQSGIVPVVENWPLVGTGAAVKSLRAYASAVNVINLNGWVNKHTTS